MTREEQQIYASIDLELSGFDPATDEIIEVGIVRFRVVAGQPVLIDSFDSLIRPTVAIRSRVLGLTGIDAATAASAPTWAEVAPTIQDLLEDAIIVGHGVDLDIKFLLAKGLAYNGLVIDTLELAQIFLPTHHSYNLENLAHALGAEQTSAHRALADANAAYQVLVKMVFIYQRLPDDAREKILQFAKLRGLTWADFFEACHVLEATTVRSVANTTYAESKLNSAESLGFQVPNISSFRTNVPSWVLAFAEREQVFKVAAVHGLEVYLGAFEYFSKTSVAELEERAVELSSKEFIALLKVLVWLAQGPLYGVLAELNWSIIGTDAKKLFTSGFSTMTPQGIVATDFRSLADFRGKRNVWIHQMDAFLGYLEQKSGIQVTWQGLVGLFKQIYNHETEQGDARFGDHVLAAIAQADLFFARVLLLIKSEQHTQEGALSPEDLGLYTWSRITQAGENLQIKLKRLLPDHSQEGNLARYLQSLKMFLGQPETADLVRWVEFADGRCSFIQRPLSVKEPFFAFARQHAKVVLHTDIRNKELQSLYVKRFGIHAENSSILDIRDSQGVFGVRTIADDSIEKQVTRCIANLERGMIVFPTVASLKSYYDTTFTELATPSSVVAVGIHGGVQKVLRNFAHNSKTVVLTAVPHLAGYTSTPLVLDQILFAGLPFVDKCHPFQKSLATNFFKNSEECVKHLQLLLFLQALRAFSLQDTKKIEIVVLPTDADQAQFLLTEAFTLL